MIGIKQHDEEWRLEIKHEEWKFETRKEMATCLDKLLEFKEKFGQLRK